MPWGRFDDQYDISQKIAPLSDAAFRMDVSAILWCNRNLTDGHVGVRDLRHVRAQFRAPTRLANELVAAGRWHTLPLGSACDSEDCQRLAAGKVDGWLIHDYLDYSKSKAQVTADRDAATERQRKAREAAAARRAAEEPDAVVTPLSRRDNGVSHASVTAMSQSPRPDPTRTPSSSGSGSADPTGPYRAWKLPAVGLRLGLAL
jgi:hypothetical protein